MRILCFASVLAISAVVAFVPSSRSSLPSAYRQSTPSVLFSATSTDTDIAGKVKWYNAERGFGFIEVDDGGPDMYVHATGLTCDGPLLENERVSFVTEIDRRTNKPKAINVVRSTSTDASTDSSNDPDCEPTKIEVEKTQNMATKAESFQRARLEAQLKQSVRDTNAAKAAAAKAAAEAEAARLAKEAEDKRIAEEAAALKAAAEAEAARLAKEAEEKRIAEEAAAKAAAEAEAARLAKEAEEKRIAEEAAAKAAAEAEAARLAKEAEEKRIAEEAAAETAARELGYPSVAIMNARQQPKSPEVEALLAAKYAAMNLEERAFTILAVSCIFVSFRSIHHFVVFISKNTTISSRHDRILE